MTVADFSGYATRNNLACSDGRTILAGAFEENDGAVVPLVWAHGHDDVDNILGHVKLENRADGVYAHAFFNKTAKGQSAKEAVRHGDIRFLSIFANKLVENIRDRVSGIKDVVKGNIREVSLVIGGANPGAVIDSINLEHEDGEFWSEEAIITTGIELVVPQEALAHADTATLEKPTEDKNDLQRILETLNEEQEVAVNYLLSQALTVGSTAQHSDMDNEDDADVDNQEDDSTDESSDEGSEDESASEEDQAEASSDEGSVDESQSDEGEGDGESEDSSESQSDEGEGDDGSSDEAEGQSEDTSESDADSDTEAGDAVQHDTTNQEDNSMTHNVFDQASQGGASADQRRTLSHDDVKGIMAAVISGNSTLSKELGDYALAHGIENIDYLFPDFKTLEASPAFITRRMEWVDKVLGAVRKAPFARIKTVTADITPDEARARGYITGNMKNEEFFALSKRETTPQTIYKKQKLDRDDVIDIADLDVVAWLKAEMKVMLDEEIASAILFGDGRSAGDEDKIKEANIRPIASDAELYVTTVRVNLDDASSSNEELVDAAITNREYYKGSGTPTFYTSETYISRFLNTKDGFGHRMYKNVSEIADVLRVKDVVPVDTMSRVSDLVGIMVNLADYTIGTDRGGQATMFDDFDLDYNKLRYLLETRLSGALTVPKSAIVFRKVAGAAALVAPNAPAFDPETGVLTVPTQTGVVYKNDAGTTLTTGAPVTVPAGESYHVTATPSSASYYFADDQHDEWTFTADEA